ncbi:MAG TPA: GGDEF domain-containing protein [Polyangiaceae bacterium]|jgi:diguanylate cyclase (GGDEF)-like protein/PAS domain S-box-containing protein|nr:MAG: putative diguanylate cyclase YegE [Deltaproteobacteria bacterium ADurb.Bin207]HNS99456.1 GGDEF domain-containing protein [Polyangiaceae bacterium]HNZ21623.1 GGDEF domain-containing protein [Polyangiaceae bacterium]HOD24149.1 GGDEF domain-containing protein [Polyangiaceae bacterium]HOE48580.1 GGDEF domain-containing protein [Polyangiaceae bacterium]
MESLLDPNVVQAILDNLSEAVCAFDLQRRITYWNHGAEELTGFAAQEVLGKKCSAGILIHVDDRGRPTCQSGCMLGQALRDRRTNDADLFIRHKNGHRVPVHVRFAPLLNQQQDVIGALQVFREGTASLALAQRVRELERLSFLDPLTNLANRRYVDITLRSMCSQLKHGGIPFGVVLLDIDDLKTINDHHGHEAGDMVLKAVAKTLLETSRPFDVKGRWGGDEYIAIVSNVNSVGLAQTAERFRALIEATAVPYHSIELRTTVSVGATMAQPSDDEFSIVRRADEELYSSKTSGKNRASITGVRMVG